MLAAGLRTVRKAIEGVAIGWIQVAIRFLQGFHSRLHVYQAYKLFSDVAQAEPRRPCGLYPHIRGSKTQMRRHTAHCLSIDKARKG